MKLIYPWPEESPSRSRSSPAGWLGRIGHDTVGHSGHRWKGYHINIGRPEIVRLSTKGPDTTSLHPVYWPSSPGSIHQQVVENPISPCGAGDLIASPTGDYNELYYILCSLDGNYNRMDIPTTSSCRLYNSVQYLVSPLW